MATVPSVGHTLTNASFLYDFSECLVDDSWKAAECDYVPVSGSEHKCSITLSCGIPFVPGKTWICYILLWCRTWGICGWSWTGSGGIRSYSESQAVWGNGHQFACGKYQLKQNVNGFALHSTKPTDTVFGHSHHNWRSLTSMKSFTRLVKKSGRLVE